MLHYLRRHWHTRSDPCPCVRADKTLMVVSGSHLHLDDILQAQMHHHSAWLKTHQARIRAASVPGQDNNQAGREPYGSHPGSVLQRRRRHHTTPPIAITIPGNPRTVMMKIPYTCCCVSTTVGSTSV